MTDDDLNSIKLLVLENQFYTLQDNALLKTKHRKLVIQAGESSLSKILAVCKGTDNYLRYPSDFIKEFLNADIDLKTVKFVHRRLIYEFRKITFIKSKKYLTDKIKETEDLITSRHFDGKGGCMFLIKQFHWVSLIFKTRDWSDVPVNFLLDALLYCKEIGKVHWYKPYLRLFYLLLLKRSK